jgi:hypothetical protein
MASLAEYAAAREAALQRLVGHLENDERLVAAWLGGSYGRGEADEVSDIDVYVVVADEYAAMLCARPQAVRAETTTERHALFGRLGSPVIVHENNHNAPPGGTMTAVWYEDGLNVDWVLMPHAAAQRPAQTRLLFERTPIAVPSASRTPSGAEREARLSERVAFFWMMAAVTAKYLRRGDGVMFHELLSFLHGIAAETEALLKGEATPYVRGARVGLFCSLNEQEAALRRACEWGVALSVRVEQEGGIAPDAPMRVVDRLLGLRADPKGLQDL